LKDLPTKKVERNLVDRQGTSFFLFLLELMKT